jgi:DNA uptake protein ComE-like DNA-binding protein
MNSSLKQFLNFDASQRKGIFGLFLLIIIMQMVLVFIDFSKLEKETPEKQQWLALQPKIDSLKSINQTQTPRIYSFNPNYITDFKGYQLGMKPAEIDRLQAFRKTNKFINSAQEFQAVTKISDSLLTKISPLFKFPDWVNNKFNNYNNNSYKKFPEKEKLVIKDINLATKEDLMKVTGIGVAISDRIISEKNKFGGFVNMMQINDIYGLSPELIEKINQSFKIFNQPNIKKMNINNADLNELKSFPYFKNGLAKKIIIFRSMNGDFKNSEDLIKIKDFPADNVKIIALYLEF